MVVQGTAAALTAEGLSELSHETAESNERAVALFERALGVDAGFAPAYTGLAKAYVQRYDLQRGRSWLEPAVTAGKRAIELDPTLGDAYLALGRAYRMKGWHREELQLWQRRAQLDANDGDARERVGWVLWFTGRAEESLPWLHAAVAQRPESRWAHFFLGNANLALGNYGEAERRYGRELELHPDHSSAQAGVIWSLLAAGRDEEARSHLRRFQTGSMDGDRYPLKLADIEHFLGEDETASRHAREALAEPEERYWPRGFLASTILGALLWPADRVGAEEQLGNSEQIDRERLEGGDEGYMAHIDLTAVEAIRGETRAACRSLRTAIGAGWRYGSLAARDRLFENLRTEPEFLSLIAA
ncbi:MAG TPA: tetratricopeptide repeat protein [Candidatus Dormibacteraeota bacterium]